MTDVPGGYDWDTVLPIGGTRAAQGRPGAPHCRSDARSCASRRMPISRPRRLLGYAPMLTPGKLREISHPDWLCDSHDFAEATGWRAAVVLEQGLARAYGRQGPGTT